MANPIVELFRGRSKIEEATKVKPDKPEERINLTTSNKVLISGTDVANADESKLIALYRQMENDSIISAALDLYADNATQVNDKTGHVVAIESADKNFQDEINEFLWKIVKIDNEAWQIVRDIARDGKIFLDTKAFNNGREWSFVPVENPALVKALTFGQDQIKYFVVSPEVEESEDSVVSQSFKYVYNKKQDTTEYQIEPSDRFIAGFNTRDIVGKMSVATESRFDEAEIVEELKIRTGRSILAPVVQTWQTLSSLEDSLYINRLTKSTEFKIVQIDVSDSNNKQAEQIINAVKDAFKSSEAIDQTTNRYQNRQSPIPINDFIYVPVKGEKGSIKVENIGGEVGEIKTNDIDYFRNKLFAGLGVLKAYLGFEETTPGGLGDSTLTKLDERLGRRVLRLQQILKSIVYDMTEYYWKHSTVARAKEEMPDFNIVLGKVSTKEEEENRARLADSISIAKDIIGIATDEKFADMVSNERLFSYIFNDVLGIDTKHFDNNPNEEDISLKIKEVQDKLLTETTDHKKDKSFSPIKANKTNIITGRIEDLMGYDAMQKLEAFLDIYDLDLIMPDGSVKSFEEAIKTRAFRKVFTEKTYAQLKDTSKSKDPARLGKSKKSSAKYKGIDKEDGTIMFEITAEDPKKNADEGKPTSYETKVALKDLAYLIGANKEQDNEMTDAEIVQMAIQGDVSVSCECPAAKYWGMQYNGTMDKDGYSLVHNDIAPTRNIPTQPICKHVIVMLTVLPFWWATIVKDLRKEGYIKAPEPKKVKGKTKEQETEE